MQPFAKVFQVTWCFYMVRAALLFILALNCVPSSKGEGTLNEKAKIHGIYKPRIPYPTFPDGTKPEGEGVFVCHVNTKTGIVKYVSVLKSTGSTLLDKTGVEALQRARFTLGTDPEVKVPIRWTRHH